MPTQVRVGLILTLGGYVGLIVSLYLKLDAAVAAAAPIMSTGSMLLGKEWFPQSEHAQRTYSRRPPPNVVGCLFLVALVPIVVMLTGCADVQLPQSQDAIDAKRALDDVADKLDARLSVARGLFDVANAGVLWVCGAEVVSERCSEARAVADGVGGYLKAADDAIDLYRETGQHFDDAMKVLKEAEESVGKLRTLVADLKRGLT